MPSSQRQIDRENSTFWNELCGTIEAKRLGITDSSKESLAKFDAWYLDFYPYLLPTVQPLRMKHKKVLEVGLGYGTLGQQLAAAGAEYTGMDLAQNPVDHMNYRLRLHNLPGCAIQGSALAMPFADGTFDFLVSIGCMHHTGNVQRCFAETHRVLAPAGVAVIMVYNKYSFMQWRRAPLATLRELFRSGQPNVLASDNRRSDYDSNAAGKAAPETALVSISELKQMLSSFAEVRCTKRNANPLTVKGITLIPRTWLLPTVGRLMGLDIYVEARKAGIVGRSAAAA
jgi:SAM-dependent methyltransferase